MLKLLLCYLWSVRGKQAKTVLVSVGSAHYSSAISLAICYGPRHLLPTERLVAHQKQQCHRARTAFARATSDRQWTLTGKFVGASRSTREYTVVAVATSLLYTRGAVTLIEQKQPHSAAQDTVNRHSCRSSVQCHFAQTIPLRHRNTYTITNQFVVHYSAAPKWTCIIVTTHPQGQSLSHQGPLGLKHQVHTVALTIRAQHSPTCRIFPSRSVVRRTFMIHRFT